MKNSEIEKLIASENGTLEIIDGFYLDRWTVNAIGEKWDGLKVRVTQPSHNYSVMLSDLVIKSRDPKGIKKEICSIVKMVYSSMAEQAIKDITGHWQY